VLVGAGVTNVTLWIDGMQVAALDAAPYVYWWTLSEGVHHFQAQGIDANGQAVASGEVEITVTE